jgi:hypothetical protein
MSAHEFPVRQAEDRLPVRKVLTIAVVAAVIGGAGVALSAAIERHETRVQRGGVTSYPAPAPPGTVEQTLVNNTRRGLDLVATQRRALESYGWVDREHGIARIPIDRAIDLTVERGP